LEHLKNLTSLRDVFIVKKNIELNHNGKRYFLMACGIWKINPLNGRKEYSVVYSENIDHLEPPYPLGSPHWKNIFPGVKESDPELSKLLKDVEMELEDTIKKIYRTDEFRQKRDKLFDKRLEFLRKKFGDDACFKALKEGKMLNNC
jgi:hypothetical protein